MTDHFEDRIEQAREQLAERDIQVPYEWQRDAEEAGEDAEETFIMFVAGLCRMGLEIDEIPDDS